MASSSLSGARHRTWRYGPCLGGRDRWSRAVFPLRSLGAGHGRCLAPVMAVSGIEVLHGVFGFRVGAVLRELDGGVDELMRLALGLLELPVRELEPLAELRDRILRRAQLFELTFRPVDLRVADVVAGQPVGLEEQEDRAAPLAS